MSSSKPTPFNEQQVAEYERRRYRGLDQRLVHWRETRILSRWLKDLAGKSDFPGLCLDAPCGYGRFSQLILASGFNLISADLSFSMVQRARKRGFNGHFPIGIVINLLAAFPFADRCFDLVLALRFFHHLHSTEERQHVLAEIGRVTRRWAIVSFYRKQPLHELQRKLRRRLRPSATRISMLPLATFSRETALAGFRLKKISALWPGLHAQHFALLEKIE